MPGQGLGILLFASLWRFSAQTENLLEGLYVISSLGTSRDPPGGAEECHRGEGSLSFPPGPVQPTTLYIIDGWMDLLKRENTKMIQSHLF